MMNAFQIDTKKYTIMKNLILIPFAYLNSFMGGVNLKGNDKSLDIYLKNSCVACVSARKNCGEDSDVALVTNIELPAEYAEVLETAGVKVMHYEFDRFSFGAKYRWSLAFYKLCALSKVVEFSEYEAFAYLDSDVYVQSDFAEIWSECKSNVLLYDISHGLQVNDYRRFLKDVTEFCGKNVLGVTQYGGEFFAASMENAKAFVQECQNVFEAMRRKEFQTLCGDEFVISMVAAQSQLPIRNAGAYVYRFWTRSFRLISTNYEYNPIAVLHVPSEKEYGMVSVYNSYVRKGKIPSRRKVWKLLHISHPSWKISILLWVRCLKAMLN